MFTIDIILGLLKKVFGGLFSFLWEYKGWVIIAIVIGALYIRGNSYKDEYEAENIAHVKTVLEYNQQINDIRLANETALRIAQEKSAANYKALVEKTSKIQKEYIQREEDINTNIDKLSASNDSLFKQIKSYTSNSNSSSGSVSDSSCSDRLLVIGELLREAKQEEQYYASEAQKLSSSVEALKAWSDSVIENSGRVNYE